VSLNQINLTWIDNSDREWGFLIERRVNGRRFKVIADVPSNTTYYSDVGLEGNITYEYRIRAYFKRFKTFYSNVATASTSNVFISSQPEIILPAGYSDWDLINEISVMDIPNKINYHFVPIGAIYELGILGEEDVDFGDEFAELHYTYDRSKLLEAGLIEDFMVFYYDDDSETWKPVKKIEIDIDNSMIVAYTNHFTTFVLTAIPSASGTIADPPNCIDDDFPDGIGGSGNAVFTIVDENFKYYQDRDYYIRSVFESGVNAVTFAELGFSQALGISTINGNSPLGPFSDHKHYEGDDYIVFIAHTDIDVYVMYDTRGGVDIYDTSEDAPWIADQGFVNTGYFLETTDAVQFYTVYKSPIIKVKRSIYTVIVRM
jgi:hypothetical protein